MVVILLISMVTCQTSLPSSGSWTRNTIAKECSTRVVLVINSLFVSKLCFVRHIVDHQSDSLAVDSEFTCICFYLRYMSDL
jgi:hypothetical protein